MNSALKPAFRSWPAFILISTVAALMVAVPAWGAEDDDEDCIGSDVVSGRSFSYWDIVFSAFYSPKGVTGLPPGDLGKDHFELSPRPPGTYLGMDYIITLHPNSCLNRSLFPDWLPLTAVGLHPRFVFDRMEPPEGIKPIRFAPQDFWLRFNPGHKDRLSLKVGQFVLPYGVNPVVAPRQRFILPLEATDLGLKWDWGVDLRGPLGDYDWEIALTMGSGEGLHSSDVFDHTDRSSFLITGRYGAPTYWDHQNGISFLIGDLPFIRAHRDFGMPSVSRWRLGFDSFNKIGTFFLGGVQVTYGQDGYAGDERFVPQSMGRTASVLGYRAWVDWIPPEHLNFRFAAQFESIVRDLSTRNTDDTALVLEGTYSMSTATMLRLDLRLELNRWMGEANNALYFTYIYYARR